MEDEKEKEEEGKREGKKKKTIMCRNANEVWPRQQKRLNSSFQSLSVCECMGLFFWSITSETAC